ncbi:hypothetical protein L9F63_009037, partial [Diploptera punctata]
YNTNGEECDKKIQESKNLLFKNKRFQKTSGGAGISWEYYNIFSDIFMADESINPMSQLSTEIREDVTMDALPSTSEISENMPANTPMSTPRSSLGPKQKKNIED